jgi:hypothetical protein
MPGWKREYFGRVLVRGEFILTRPLSVTFWEEQEEG